MRNIYFAEGENHSKLSWRQKVNAENNLQKKQQVHFHRGKSTNKISDYFSGS